MENQTISTRVVRLKYKDSYVQAVILPDGRKVGITGSTSGMGAPLSPLSEIGVAQKSDLKWVLQDLVTYGYEEVNGSRFYDELRDFNSTMSWS